EHGFVRDQFLADAESAGAGKEVIGGILLRDAASGNQRDLRERPVQSADVVVAADQRGGENLDKIRARVPGGENFGGSHGTGHHDEVGESRDVPNRGDVEGAGDGHGEFNDRDAGVADLFHGKARILGGRGADYRHETYFFNAGTQRLLFHG